MRFIDHLPGLLLGLVLLSTGCVPPSPKAGWPVQDVYDYAQERFAKRDYLRATEGFQIITLNYSGSDLVDDALFYLGESHRLAKEYPLAVVTYRRLIRDFPQSPYADDAQYELAVSIFKQSSPVSLTQDKTFEAIRELQIFVDEFPDSEVNTQALELLQTCYDKLAEKDYKTGHLYFRLHYFDAARLYFSEMINQFPSSRWARDAQYEIAESYAREKNWSRALAEFNVFMQRYPDHERIPEAEARISEVKAALAKANGETVEKPEESKSGTDGKAPVRQATDSRMIGPRPPRR